MAEAERWVADTVRWVAESCLNIVDDRMKDRQGPRKIYDRFQLCICLYKCGNMGGGGEDLAN